MNGQVHLYAKCTAVTYYVFNVVFENQIHFRRNTFKHFINKIYQEKKLFLRNLEFFFLYKNIYIEPF